MDREEMRKRLVALTGKEPNKEDLDDAMEGYEDQTQRQKAASEAGLSGLQEGVFLEAEMTEILRTLLSQLHVAFTELEFEKLRRDALEAAAQSGSLDVVLKRFLAEKGARHK